MASSTLDYSSPSPLVGYLTDPAILVQAWKKAHSYIRSHNWYADSLELDVSTIQLRQLIADWSKLLTPDSLHKYEPDPMRLVPAPKSTKWTVEDGWRPEEPEQKLRPLAHLSIRDQSLTMAALICLADAVETAQGDPTQRISARTRANVVSYGHRLVAKWEDGRATFRWGNSKLYRQYFLDYQQFVHRPERIRQELFPTGGSWAIVQADLTQFYDLIPRDKLITRLRTLTKKAYGKERVDSEFFQALERLFGWSWFEADAAFAKSLCKNTDSSGLPQGLAASGFFANAYMLAFDRHMVTHFGKRPRGFRWRIVDYCRYVDDMRFVIELDDNDIAAFEAQITSFLQTSLDSKAPGLKLNPSKTQVMYGDSHAPNVAVADAMQAVNESVSGPLDVETAKHALEMLDGLLAVSNSRQSQVVPTGTGQDEMLRRILSVEPDVRNDTLERFVAHRWRRVYRALRIMADADAMTDTTLNVGRTLLDQRANSFAVGLLRKWISDPSNVRLLRVSLDLFPSSEHLQVVLNFLRSHLNAESPQPRERAVCEYIAAEVLRAGATETGFVRDDDELPAGIEIKDYRRRLLEFAVERMVAPESPWFLQQQALLCLAVFHQVQDDVVSTNGPDSWYVALHQVLSGAWPTKPDGNDWRSSLAIPLIVSAHQISGDTEGCASLIAKWIEVSSPDEVQQRIGDYLSEDTELLQATLERLPASIRGFWTDHCVSIGYLASYKAIAKRLPKSGLRRLLDLMVHPDNPFQQETASLRLAKELCTKWPKHDKRADPGLLTPSRIGVRCKAWDKLADPTATLGSTDFEVSILPSESIADRRFQVPKWCAERSRWKYEIGQVVRAAVLGQPDYSRNFSVSPVIPSVHRYKGTSTSWFKRKHGLLNERPGLGDRLLPVSPWLSELLDRLLEWPGVRTRRQLVRLRDNVTPNQLANCITTRLNVLAQHYCRLSGMPLYTFPVPDLSTETRAGHFRIAVVQTALPQHDDFTKDDLELSNDAYRRRHRRHLSAMLRLLMKTLEVRKGYKDTPEKVDLVVFPELSVHRSDIPLLVRFADSVKSMVFCGLVFHPMPRQPSKLINSGLWILPVRTEDGRTMKFVEQGKGHLTPEEEGFGIHSFRPCQWLIEARSGSRRPWGLSAAICYDATDLRLAADLCKLTDAFVVAALNRDIGTFDAMVSALHYHMFQHVVLVNSAQFGGSTAQAPYSDSFNKVIVHHHGMDQPVVSVIDLNLSAFRGRPTKKSKDVEKKVDGRKKTKYPPAGMDR